MLIFVLFANAGVSFNSTFSLGVSLNRANSALDHYLSTYANIILIVDFNFCVENNHLAGNLENNNLSSLINVSLPVTTLITPLVLVSF